MMGETADMHRRLVEAALARGRELLQPVPDETQADTWRRQAEAGFWIDTAALHLRAADMDGPRFTGEPWGVNIAEMCAFFMRSGEMTVDQARKITGH